MRIRTQLVLSAVFAVLVSLSVIAALFEATRQSQRGIDEQARSQDVVRHIANMLALTNELAVYGGDRIAVQWHARAAQLSEAVAGALHGRDGSEPTLLELQQNIDDLPPLFDKLVEIGRQPPSELGQRRHELLMERMLAETQEVVESRHRWALAIADRQQRSQRLYSATLLAAPSALLLLLLSLGFLVGRRVLEPTRRLQIAALAIQNGDLDARCASTARDELGDAARAVDAMAVALRQRSADLKDSENRLQMITDNAPALIGHLDTENRYTFANAQHSRSTAGVPPQLLGRTIEEVHGQALWAVFAPHSAQALAGQEVSFETSRVVDDRVVHQQTTFVPDIGDTGSVQGYYAISFDITKRKEAELRLAASERLLANITDNLPALVAYVGSDERYGFANSKYRDWLGVDPATMIGQRVEDVMGPAFYAAVKNRGNAALAGQRSRWERCGVHDGRERHYLVDFIPDIDAEGRVRGFCALTNDITELKEAQQMQAKVERQLRAIADNLPVLIGYVGPDERYRFVNATAGQVLGIDPVHAVGRSMAESMSATSYAARRDHLRAALGGKRVEFTLEIGSEGSTRHLQTTYIPDVRPDGRIDGAYLLGLDVTVLKQSEQQLQQMARFDVLTKLPNRRQLEERLGEAVARSTRDRRPIALMFLDIDHFKRINDSFGHAVGDAVLVEFAKRLRQSVRVTDMPARLAGDEFVVLLEGLHAEADASIVAQKIVAAIRQPFHVPSADLHVTTSVGVAYAARPAPNSDLMDFADQALYRAKGAGRDTFEISTLGSYDSTMGTLPMDSLVQVSR